MEVETRRLFLPEGCSTMFAYCTRVLRFSERAAYARIMAARTARKFPVILDRVAEGSLNLTSILLLAPHTRRLRPSTSSQEATYQARRVTDGRV